MRPLLLLLLLLAAPPLPASSGWFTLPCRTNSLPPLVGQPAVLLEGCSVEELPQVTRQIPAVTDLWLRSLTLSQSSYGARSQGRHSAAAADCSEFPRLAALKISHTAFGGHNMAAGLAAWLGCDSLERLDLSECSGSGVLQVAGLAGQQLHLLNLSSNQLSELQEGAFKKLSQLRILDLSHNRLARLPGGIFGRTQRLTHLHLQHNAISALARQSFLGKGGPHQTELPR